MAELADALDLGSSSKEWGFKSSCPHQNKKNQSVRLIFFERKTKKEEIKVNKIREFEGLERVRQAKCNGVAFCSTRHDRSERSEPGVSPLVRTRTKNQSNGLIFLKEKRRKKK